MDINFDVPFDTLFKPAQDWTTPSGIVIPHRPFKKYLRTDLAAVFQSQGIMDPLLEEREIVAQVFPFKINAHIIDQIDWSNYENDPIFQLTFPQPDMLLPNEIEHMKQLKKDNASRELVAAYISDLRSGKNPAPANQSANRPLLEDDHEDSTIPCDGLQHKYKQIVLMFHKNAQTCHAYCTYCFRFNQFTGKDKFLEPDEHRLHKYLKSHTEITDVLMTGGDPATMKVDVWKRTIEPLLTPEFAHIRTIRIGTKALTYHPYRFLTDPDADELISLFKRVKQAGKHIAIMAHFSHYNEISDITKEAARRLIEEGGCVIRTQAPIMKHINDKPEIWAKNWQIQIANGMIPYYMFVARDTGPQHYFEVPLAKTLWLYQEARKMGSGLSHTVRGPSMSSGPGKITILGKENVAGEDVFVLKFLQGRNPHWCDRVFFAKYDEKASWIHELVPAFGKKEFFFEEEFKCILESRSKHYNDAMKDS